MDTKQKKKSIITLCVFMAVLTLLCAFYTLINPAIIKMFDEKFNIVSNKNATIVHFISVGQGDAAAINLPDGKVLLIDAGPVNSNVTYTKYIQEKVLGSKRNKKIDYLVMTHADADHIGGVLKLLKNFNVQNIYMPVVTKETETFQDLYDYIYNHEINRIDITDAQNIESENYSVKFFAPVNNASSNDSCPLVKLVAGNKSFLFTGDISENAEKQFVTKYGEELDSDILKVAHHGSKYSSSMEFLSVVSPEYSIISCGANSYGHPTEQAIINLISSGSVVYRTDLDGNMIFVKSNKYELSFHAGGYTLTPLSLNYCVLILAIDVVIVVTIIDISLKKNKKQRRKTVE